jgi:hypothetical protein
MNDALRSAAAIDPKWARREARRRVTLLILAVGVLVAVAVGIPALVIGLHNGTEISVIQHSPCQVEAAGKECQQIKTESDEAASLHTSCVQFRKVDLEGKLLSKTRCKGSDLPSSPVVAGSIPPAKSGARGGDAASTGNPGHSQPGPHGGGGGGPTKVDGGGEGVKESPEKSTAPSSTAPSSSTSPQSSSTSTVERTSESTVVEPAPEATHPVTEGVGKVLEGVGTTVQETGGTVDEVVHGATCSLGLGCPK